MADFRKWLYALAVVALLAGFTVPMSAQAPPFQCVANAGVPPIVRAEGYTELVGDLTLNCTGGVPTPAGQFVPQVNVTILLSTNITSKLLTGAFNEALLIIDEPHSSTNPGRPLVNCGAAGAPDSGIQGPGVCGIVATANPALTYDGNAGRVYSTTLTGDVACGAAGSPAGVNSGTIGCGRPNVYQGRQGVAQNTGQANSVVFLGVPLDPPGTTTNRTIRITNVRGNAVLTGVSSTFTTSQIQMNVSINGVSSVSINNPQQIVAYVQRGLATATVSARNVSFLQCNSEFGSGTGGTNLAAIAAGGTSTPGLITAFTNSGTGNPVYRFAEGFASSFKVRNIQEVLTYGAGGPSGSAANTGNGIFNGTYWQYTDFTRTNNANVAGDVNQNVPGAIYNTESGFTNAGASSADPNPNPPQGIGTFALTAAANSVAFNTGATGIALPAPYGGAGVATQGTRLAVTVSSVPTGVSLWVSPTLFLYRQGATGAQSVVPANTYTTGVAVLVSTAADGQGTYTRSGAGQVLVQVPSTNLIVYEILFADPFTIEQLDIPMVVAYTANLNANLPQPNVTAQAAGGFAPFSTASSWGSPSATLAVPRFIPGTVPADLLLVSKCACNLLFPYIVSAAGYDSGIALANTSVDPGATFGFSANVQSGAVQFWYYGTGANGGAPPATQCTNTTTPGACPGTTTVPGGQVLTYVASSGSTQWGLDNRAAGFIGYVITQAQFQYCHAFAYISALGAGPLTPGTSEGYLGLLLDNNAITNSGAINRTSQRGENLVH